MSKDFYNTVYEIDHPSQYGGGVEGMPVRTSMLESDTRAWLDEMNLSSNRQAAILEVGCGMAFLSSIHPGWHGAEYSKVAVERVKARNGHSTKIFEEDAQALSFRDETFDGIFTWAALEHVPNPHKAFTEIDRVLRKGGTALIAPAWNCRSWTVKKIEERPAHELNWIEKIEKALIPIRELLVVRAVIAFPKRLVGELKMLSATPQPLRFKKLSPRWDLIEKYGHVSDDDAVADIDIHAGICFFKSRDYEILSHNSLMKRLMARHEPVIVRKVK